MPHAHDPWGISLTDTETQAHICITYAHMPAVHWVTCSAPAYPALVKADSEPSFLEGVVCRQGEGHCTREDLEESGVFGNGSPSFTFAHLELTEDAKGDGWKRVGEPE